MRAVERRPARTVSSSLRKQVPVYGPRQLSLALSFILMLCTTSCDLVRSTGDLFRGVPELVPLVRTINLRAKGLSLTAQGRYAEAEPLLRRALAIREDALWSDDMYVAQSCDELALVYFQEDRYPEAETLYTRELELYQKEFGSDRFYVAAPLAGLGLVYRSEAHYADAERSFKRALAVTEATHGPYDLEVAKSLDNLATVYEDEGRYAEAEPLFKRELEIREHIYYSREARILANLTSFIKFGFLDKEGPKPTTAMMNLANLYEDEGRYADAEALTERALTIDEKALGPEHPTVAIALHNLAYDYQDEGRYADAEPLVKRALVIDEKALGPNHTAIAEDLDGLAQLYVDEGRYADAEPLYTRALAIREKALGPSHPGVAKSLSELSWLYENEGRYAEAEPNLKRALAIDEQALGPDHPYVAAELNNLAQLYWVEGRFADAEPLYQRALVVYEKALGLDHPDIATVLNNLAELHVDERRYADAEPLFKRALAIREKALGPDHPDVAHSLNNLAELYVDEGYYAEAEPLVKRALAIDEKALGSEHRDVANSLNNLSKLYDEEGRYSEAEPLSERALAIDEKALGTNHPAVALSFNRLALTYAMERKAPQSREAYEHARAITLAVERGNQGLDEQAIAGLVRIGTQFLPYYSALLASIARSPALDPSLAPPDAEALAFVVAEQARGIGTQGALAKAALRALAGDPKSAALARRVQDLENQSIAISKQLDAEYAKPAAQHNATRIQNLQQGAQTLDRELTAARADLLKALPTYGELAVPNPIDLSSTRKLLGPDEALVSYYVLGDRVLSWLVLASGAPSYRDTPIKHNDLKKIIGQVRASLVPDHPYDVSDSFALYKLLLQPFADELGGVKRLIIVPDRELFSIPFAALVTTSEGTAYKTLANEYYKALAPSPAELHDDYPRIAWLAKQHFSLALLPSATSLRLLRQIASSKGHGTNPLIGIGDPTLQGKGRDRGGAMLATRGAEVVGDIRQLPRLPGTRDELLAEARALGANPDRDLFMQDRATRATVMNLNRDRLANARVVSFATHALTGGELKAYLEPALVLTPPKEPTPDDNGLLVLADIMQLHLGGSEWVILSACNTANGGDGFSGLVRGFFFAGAPALLVSQWSVNDDATDHLMTELFRYNVANPRTSRAEVLRQAILSVMNSEGGANEAFFAHPFAWAPFVLVGDGGPASS
jgi:CHAT domain-containing protein/Tfp pilus assembly protein PilF